MICHHLHPAKRKLRRPRYPLSSTFSSFAASAACHGRWLFIWVNEFTTIFLFFLNGLSFFHPLPLSTRCPHSIFLRLLCCFSGQGSALLSSLDWWFDNMKSAGLYFGPLWPKRIVMMASVLQMSSIEDYLLLISVAEECGSAMEFSWMIWASFVEWLQLGGGMRRRLTVKCRNFGLEWVFDWAKNRWGMKDICIIGYSVQLE